MIAAAGRRGLAAVWGAGACSVDGGDAGPDARDRAAAGDRLGRGLHARPRGAAAPLVPGPGRPAAVRGRLAAARPGRSWSSRRARRRPVPTRSTPARSSCSTPRSSPGSGRSPARSRTATRRSTRWSAWSATSWRQAGPDLPRARLGPMLVFSLTAGRPLRFRRPALGRLAGRAGGRGLGLPAQPLRPRPLRDLRRLALEPLGRLDPRLRLCGRARPVQPSGARAGAGPSSSACWPAARPTPS